MRGAFVLGVLLLACSDGKEIRQQVEDGPKVNMDANRERTTQVGKELYLWALPMVRGLQGMTHLSLYPNSGAHLGDPNTLLRPPGLLGPNFDAVDEPGHDMLYLGAVLDLRAEPQVITWPAVPDRYHSLQLSDVFGYNFAYAGTRATGSDGGTYVVAGPRWEGSAPEGTTLFRSDSELVMMIGRVLARGEEGVASAHAIYDQVTLKPLSEHLGTAAPPAAEGDLPMYGGDLEGVEYIKHINELLALTVPPSEEAEKLKRFSHFGIGAGSDFERAQLGPAAENALRAGLRDGRQAVRQEVTRVGENGWVGSQYMHGSREQLRGKDLEHAAGAVTAPWDASREEALYLRTLVDADERALDGKTSAYTLTFPAGELPPGGAFWSVSPYSLPDRRLVGNPIDRYGIHDGSPVEKGPDGSITIHLSADKPDAPEANWLPVPHGPFYVVIRMFLPEEGAVDYVAPPIRRVEEAP